jgi:adenylate kinase
MDRGVLVPDEVTIKMVMTWVDENKSAGGFILDGFPRTLNQAEALDSALSIDGGINKVLYINVPQKELIRRLTGRLICQNCQRPYQKVSAPSRVAGKCDACGEKLYQRDDDKGEAVYERLRVYQNETEPLIAHYNNANILYEIDGENSVEKVRSDLVNALNS